MNRMETLRGRVAAELTEDFHATFETFDAFGLADAALAALGLDDDTMAVVADSRYSAEFIGNLLRSKLLATQEGENG